LIISNSNNASNRYVNTLKVNGVAYDQNWLNHLDLQKGATLDFGMSAVSNKTRGIKESTFPYSLSTEKK
jgi:putative alpha-1,2-mannosidase